MRSSVTMVVHGRPAIGVYSKLQAKKLYGPTIDFLSVMRQAIGKAY